MVLAGEDPASAVYVRNKEKAAEEAGIAGAVHRLPASVGEAELLALVQRLNTDPSVDGILVQLPLPKGISAEKVLDAIDPAKDVDGFHPVNVGALWTGSPGLLPCTPRGCMRLLKEAGASLVGANAVVIGRSNIVGKPMAALLLAEHATVTLAHSRTRDLPGLCRQADVIVAADHRPVRTLADLGDILEPRQIGQEITLRVTRGGATFDAQLTLAARPAAPAPTEHPNEEATPAARGE